MARPQLENGYTRLSNELLEALYRKKFRGLGLSIVLWVIRNTYGWNRKAVTYSCAKLAKDINSKRSHASRSVKKLIENKVLYFPEKRKISIQKNHDKWFKPPKLPYGGSPQGNKTIPYGVKNDTLGGFSLERVRVIQKRQGAGEGGEAPPLPAPSQARNTETATTLKNSLPKAPKGKYWKTPGCFCSKCGGQHLPIHPCREP